VAADGVVTVDSSALTLEQVVDVVLGLVAERTAGVGAGDLDRPVPDPS